MSTYLQCRLCAEWKVANELININHEKAIQIKLVTKIQQCLNLNFDNLKLPENVCLLCCDKVGSTYDFQELVKKAQQKLFDAIEEKIVYIKTEIPDPEDEWYQTTLNNQNANEEKKVNFKTELPEVENVWYQHVETTLNDHVANKEKILKSKTELPESENEWYQDVDTTLNDYGPNEDKLVNFKTEPEPQNEWYQQVETTLNDYDDDIVKEEVKVGENSEVEREIQVSTPKTVRVRRRNCEKKRIPIDPESMKLAVQAVTGPNKVSMREAARIFNVKFSTLLRHVNLFKASGATDFEYKASYDVKKVFTEEEELKLIEYVKTITKMNKGLTKKQLREVAYQFAVTNKKRYPSSWDIFKLAGEEWMRLFLKRHSDDGDLTINLLPTASFYKTTLAKFFDNLNDVHKRFGPFPPQRIWTQNEIAVTTEQDPSTVISVKKFGDMTLTETEHLIIISACSNALGNLIPPMMLFPSAHYKDYMIKGAPPGTIGEANFSGGLNEELFYKFMEHFIKHTKPSKEERVILITDNDETHLAPKTLELASNAGVVFVTFPPQISHKLQPLNISVFLAFKLYYDLAVQSWLVKNPGKKVGVYNVAECVGKAYPKAFTTDRITSGFEKAGIYPLDKAIPKDNEIGEENTSSSKRKKKSSLQENVSKPSTSTSSPESYFQNKKIKLEYDNLGILK